MTRQTQSQSEQASQVLLNYLNTGEFDILQNQIITWFEDRNRQNILDSNPHDLIYPPFLVHLNRDIFQLNQTYYEVRNIHTQQQMILAGIILQENIMARQMISEHLARV